MKRAGEWYPPEERPETEKMQKTVPEIGRLIDPARLTQTSQAQIDSAAGLGLGGNLYRKHDATPDEHDVADADDDATDEHDVTDEHDHVSDEQDQGEEA